MKARQILAHPDSSFTFYPSEFLYYTILECLTPTQVGRLFTRIMQAVDRKDVAFLRPYRSFIGRIYYRDYERPPVPPHIKAAVFARDGRACVSCGSRHRLELDHFIPYSKGGLTTVENLRVLCKSCNCRKGSRMPEVGIAG